MLFIVKVALSVGDRVPDSESSSSTWPTGDRTSATFGASTSLLALLVSSQCTHDLHRDAPDAVDASTLSFLSLSRQKSGRSELTVASSLWRAQSLSSLRCYSPKLADSSAVNLSPPSTR